MIIDASKGSRDTLKSYFVSNAIPTAAQFAQLIDSQLNQREDRLVKTPDAPLSIEGVGPEAGLRKVLDLYEDLADTTPSWSFSLRARPNDTRRSLAIGDGAGNARLAIDATSGNVGLGTAEPRQRLDVSGDIGLSGRLALSSSTDNWLRLNQAGAFGAGTATPGLFAPGSLNVGGLNNWANPGGNNAVVAGSLGVGVFAPTDRVHVDGRLRAGALTIGPWPPNANYVFLGSSLLDQSNHQNYGILFGTGAEPGATLVNSNNYIGLRIRNAQHVILTGEGRVGMGTHAPRARLEVANGAIMPAAGDGEAAGILFPPDAFGGGGDRAWIRWLSRSGEQTTLEIGVANDPDDHIALMASGNVGIGTRTPSSKLHVVGDATISGQLTVGQQQEWVDGTLQNGWSNYGGGYAPAGYMRDSLGFVHLRGLVRNGTMQNAIFTLPIGFRPRSRHLSCRSSAGESQGRVDIATNGQVLPWGGNAGWVSLDGIVFQAAPFAFVLSGIPFSVFTGGNIVGGQQ